MSVGRPTRVGLAGDAESRGACRESCNEPRDRLLGREPGWRPAAFESTMPVWTWNIFSRRVGMCRSQLTGREPGWQPAALESRVLVGSCNEPRVG